MRRTRFALAAALLGGIPCTPALATLGVFEHGNGIKSMGMGGVVYSFAEETTVLGANPAHASQLGNRWDLGVDAFGASANQTYQGNSLAPDSSDKSDGRTYYMIPQGGFSHRLDDRWSLGVTILSAGLGPDYDGSPYQRFGGHHRLTLNLASSGIVSALAYKITPDQSVGVSLNTGYQVLRLQGLQFLDDAQTSSAPGHVTNQGKDGAFTVGFTAGWYGRLAPWLSAGLAYRTKNWSQRHDEYRGLVAGHGTLDLPAIYGGGFAIAPTPTVTVVLEAQRYNYRDETAFRNGIGKLAEGARLGDNDGPGFGWHDQNAYKLGLAWQPSPDLVLRAGYIYATKIVKPSETVFAALGCLSTTNQYTAGGTYSRKDWELSLYGYVDPKKTVHGKDSIPASFGGGEASISDQVYGLGFSVGRRFGL